VSFSAICGGSLGLAACRLPHVLTAGWPRCCRARVMNARAAGDVAPGRQTRMMRRSMAGCVTGIVITSPASSAPERGHELNHDVQVACFGDDARGEAGLAACGVQDRPQAARAGERDDRLVAQGAQWHRPARCERVLGLDRQHGRLVGHQDRLQAGRGVLAGTKAEERGVQVACVQPVEQLVGLTLYERELDAGYLRPNAPMVRTMRRSGSGMTSPTRSWPVTSPRSAATACRPCSTCARAARAWGSNASPADVRATVRRSRCSNRSPSSASSAGSAG